MKRGVIASDLHSGSSYAPLPPNFITYDGTAKTWNPAMEYLWKCWDDFTWRAGQFDPDFIVINGDCIEGPQRKSEGFELTLISMDDQVQACIGMLELLKARAPRAKWYFTQGTPYHVGHWNAAEEAIAKRMGGVAYPSVGPGKHCRQVLWLTTEGVIIEFAHHLGGASGFYRLTAIDREMQWSAMAAKDKTKGIPKADLLVRSHLHAFSRGEHASKEGIVTPCWKLGDNHSRKGGVHRFHPDIGGLLLEIDGEAKKRNENPCRIIKELYSLPPVGLTEL